MPHPAAVGQMTAAAKLLHGFGVQPTGAARKRRRKIYTNRSGKQFRRAAAYVPVNGNGKRRVRRGTLKKGSAAAKAYMAKLRRMRRR
jgi:hypothetical protein